jgi:hypothetical protein
MSDKLLMSDELQFVACARLSERRHYSTTSGLLLVFDKLKFVGHCS